MKITYIGHSGFLVETDECALLFDYYQGEIPPLPADTRLYVFASHNHHDHFNPEIFKLRGKYPNTTYILSHDITNRGKVDSCSISPDESVGFADFDVKTTDSTDQGVSFLVSLRNGKTVFHAGDLNWWTWIGEETDEDARIMAERFKLEVAKLETCPIDVAFLPLDPRQQERYFWGFDYYMRHLKIAYAFPMHCWGKDEVVDRLIAAEISGDYRNKIRKLTANGESCLI